MGIMMIAGTERRRQGCSLQDGKQWGYQTVHGTNPVTYDLPIPFEEAPFTVAISTGNSGNHASCGGFTKTTIVLRAGTTAGVWDTVGFFIIGCQLQWGMNTIGSRTTRTEAYPLPYSEFCLPIVSGKGYIGGLNYGFGIGVTNFGLTSVTIANNSEDSSYRWTGYTYIVVGAQPQWGINTGGAVRTSTLPIPFTNVFLAVASTSSEWCCPGCSATNTTVTTRAYQSNRPDVAQPNDVNWIIIGCQPQWGYSTGGSGAWALKFNGVYTAVVVGAPGFPAREFCGFTFDYTLTGWSFAAGYNSPVSYIRPTTTAISLGY